MHYGCPNTLWYGCRVLSLPLPPFLLRAQTSSHTPSRYDPRQHAIVWDDSMCFPVRYRDLDRNSQLVRAIFSKYFQVLGVVSCQVSPRWRLNYVPTHPATGSTKEYCYFVYKSASRCGALRCGATRPTAALGRE